MRRYAMLCVLAALIPLLTRAATYTWDGTTNFWNTAHWNPGPVAGGNNTNDTYVVGAGDVRFSVNDTFGIHTTDAAAAEYFQLGKVYSYTVSGKTIHLKPLGIFSVRNDAEGRYPDVTQAWYGLSPFEVANLGKGPWSQD